SRRRHTRFDCDWSSDVCSSDLPSIFIAQLVQCIPEILKSVADTSEVTFKISGMHCTSCAMNIDGEIEELEGVLSSSTHYARAFKIGRASCRERVYITVTDVS